MLKTNSKKFQENFKKEIIKSLEIHDEINGKNDQIKLTQLAEQIKNEMNYKYNIKKFPNTQARLSDNLTGGHWGFIQIFPQTIIEQAERLIEGKYEEGTKARERVIAGYYDFMALQLMKLIERETGITFHVQYLYN